MRISLLSTTLFLILNFCTISLSYADGNRVEFRTGDDLCIVTVCTDNMLNIDYRPSGNSSPSTPIIDPNLAWSPVRAKIDNKKTYIRIETDSYSAIIHKTPFSVEIHDAEGNLLVTQQAAPQNGQLSFTHDPADNYYGLSGYNRDVNRGIQGITRNQGGRIQAQPQGGSGGPFIWSSAGYGILLDTDGGEVTNTNGQLTFKGCSQANFNYFIIVGTPRELIYSAGQVTGLPPMFPKWNCGFGQLEWGITEDEFKRHIAGYRERSIPFDWFMLDFDWMDWGADNYGEFRWGPNFPSGPTGGMKSWSEAHGVKITGITKPRIIGKNADGSFTAQGQYAEDHGFWYPGEDFYNDYFSGKPSKDLQFAIPECRTWWWEHLCEGGFDQGVVGFLNDECDDANGGGLYSLGNFSNLHMQQSIYEGQRAHCDTRVWSVNRTGYLGSQRYAYSVWSGDNYPNFADLQTQPAKLLTANNILMPIWGFCATAFWDTEPFTPEFYIRSVQTAFYAPLFFLHGTINMQKQPWFYGEDVVEATREVVNLRYRLIPYLYAYDRVKHETMLGIARALVIEWPDDPHVADMSETFLFGDYLLASPVLEQGISEKSIYLPEGTWTDFFSGQRYEGGRTIDYAIDNRTFRDMPLFIREGAIIPTQEVMNYVGETSPEVIQLDIFPGAQATSFPLYDDDGATYAYEQGDYFKQEITREDRGKEGIITFATPEGSFRPTFGTYLLGVHYRNASDVTVGKNRLTRYNSREALLAAEGDGYCIDQDRYGTVTLIKTSVPERATQIRVTGPLAPPAP